MSGSTELFDELPPQARLFCCMALSTSKHVILKPPYDVKPQDEEQFDEELLIELYQPISGGNVMTVEDIAEKMGISGRYIFVRINRLINQGRLESRRNRRKQINKYKREKIVEMYYTHSYKEIAKALNTPMSTVTGIVRSLVQDGTLQLKQPKLQGGDTK